MSKTFFYWTMVLLLVAISLPLKAQDQEAEEEEGYRIRFQFSPLGGMLAKSDFSVEGLGEIYYDSNYIAGARMALFFSQKVGIEGTVIYNRVTAFLTPQEDTAPEKANYSALLYQVNIIYDLGELDIVPFITGGIGRIKFQPPSESHFPISQSNTTINLGGGVKYFMSEWFGFRVDFRTHFFRLQDEKGGFSPFMNNLLEISGGIVLSF